jgi:hypothetical protein
MLSRYLQVASVLGNLYVDSEESPFYAFNRTNSNLSLYKINDNSKKSRLADPEVSITASDLSIHSEDAPEIAIEPRVLKRQESDSQRVRIATRNVQSWLSL